MRYDVVVIGGGVVGLAAARAAARRGSSVLLLEQFAFDHERGSSHGSVRAFAFAHSDPVLVDQSVEALALWRELEAEQHVELITTTGSGLRIAKLDGIAARLEANGLSYEILDPEQVAERFDIRFGAGNPIILTHEGGTIHAARALRALRSSALANGAELLDQRQVTLLHPDADGVTVACEDGSIHRAAVAIVAAGPWAAGLLAPLGIALETKTTRQTIAYYPFERPGLLPCIYEDGHPPVYWVSAPDEGLKIGEARHDVPGVEPDTTAGPQAQDVERLTAYVSRHFPGVSTTPSRAETCLVTDTSNGEYRLERSGAVVYAATCCGRGFKFAPRTGELLADLAYASETAVSR
jgi:monomeric sarcosine oxidase